MGYFRYLCKFGRGSKGRMALGTPAEELLRQYQTERSPASIRNLHQRTSAWYHLTALFGCPCCLDSRVATQEEGQNYADCTADQCEKEGVIETHRRRVLPHTGLQGLSVLANLLGAGGSHTAERMCRKARGYFFRVICPLLRQVGGEDCHTHCPGDRLG